MVLNVQTEFRSCVKVEVAGLGLEGGGGGGAR